MTTAMTTPPFSRRREKRSYGMAYSGIFHLHEYFIPAYLIESDGYKLEGRLRLRHDESLSFNICEGHVDMLVIVLFYFPLLFSLTTK